jgi:hypothetical protein
VLREVWKKECADKAASCSKIESQSALGRSKTPHRLKDWGGKPSELITIRKI